MDFAYDMPVQLYFGRDCVKKHAAALALGKKALVVTGRHSAARNGSLADVSRALEKAGAGYVLFDQVEENPSVETVVAAAEVGRTEEVDFVVGIGGGSPMDAAKAAALLLANPAMTEADLFTRQERDYLPFALVPTTAGTGSEATQYAVLTRGESKQTAAYTLFAKAAFLDPRYLEDLPVEITRNTAVDALSHLIEGFLSKKANPLSDRLALAGFRDFRDCMPALLDGKICAEDRERLLLASTVAGMVIAQAGTSLPHGLGYALTTRRGIPHGRANGILTPAYLRVFQDRTKVKALLDALGFADINGLEAFLKKVLGPREEFTEAEAEAYTQEFMKNPAKLAAHPETLWEAQILEIYRQSLLQ